MMSLCSVDTNILLYAANEDAPEHLVCKNFMQTIVDAPADWVVADQVYFELYVALRNPKVMERPMSAGEASEHVSTVRNELCVMHCAYRPECWNQAVHYMRAEDFPFRRTHDAVLAATLLAHGVKVFYTRNTKDFVAAGFDQVVNPVDLH
jgi:predicted nucleic acid-binding protein